MSIFLYVIRGFLLIWYVLSPSYRRQTNARWKTRRHHTVAFEIVSGVIGLSTMGVLVFVLCERWIGS